MEANRSTEKNLRVYVTGLVQGVGFRPHVYRTAQEWRIAGSVENRVDGVVIHARGIDKDLEGFIEGLQHRNLPAAAAIESITVRDEKAREFSGFHIVQSRDSGDVVTRISPDLAVCPDCLADMLSQPHRLRYPFINCTNCGPRFSIVNDVPYDRKNTTMADFPMCDTCRGEYTDINDRRYHAQPVACHTCGPTYFVETDTGVRRDTDEIVRMTATCIDSGRIAAVMGLGGYHLVCDGTNKDAVALLRRRKRRDAKPFALMMRTVDTVRKYCRLNSVEEKLLVSSARPIVLIKTKGNLLPRQIADGLDTIGVMLPYLPFHYLLFEIVRTDVLVMTSGNRRDEPIVISPNAARETLGDIADLIVSHNRRIQNRVDDSVAFIAADTTHLIRRSRGWVPDPVLTARSVAGIAAFGGELKSTFALGCPGRVVVSQHIGNLDNAAVLSFYKEAWERFTKLFRFVPKLVVHDLHPDYLSTRLARERAAALGLPIVAVQHHRAHIASVMIEHGLTRPVIGVCYDGTGYGDDGTVWGAEVFAGDMGGLIREYHLLPIALPGGDLAARQPWRTAVSCLALAYGNDYRSVDLPLWENVTSFAGPAAVDQIDHMLARRINTPVASSMGRLFDAVAALLGMCLENRYEGEAPMRLEASADPDERGRYVWEMDGDLIDIRPLITRIVADIQAGVASGTIAARFMHTVAAFTFEVAERVRERTGIGDVVLSGGVFQNRFLLEACRTGLVARGFTVFTNVRVPANDGGLALGQVGLASVV